MIHLKRLMLGSILIAPFMWVLLMFRFPLIIGSVTILGIIYSMGYSITEARK